MEVQLPTPSNVQVVVKPSWVERTQLPSESWANVTRETSLLAATQRDRPS